MNTPIETESGPSQFLRRHKVERDNVAVLAEIAMSELVSEEHTADSDFPARKLFGLP